MLLYCLKCKNNTENINLKVLETEISRTMLSSKCYHQKKIKIYETTRSKRIISSLGIKTPLSNIPLLGKILFS